MLYYCQVVKIVEPMSAVHTVPILILVLPDDGCYGEAAQIGLSAQPLSWSNHGSDWAELSAQPLSRSNHGPPHGPPQSPDIRYYSPCS